MFRETLNKVKKKGNRRVAGATSLILLALFIPFKSVAATSYISSKLDSSKIGTSVTVTVSAAKTLRFYIEYGPTEAKFSMQTKPKSLNLGNQSAILLSDLKANSKYFYRLRYTISTKSIPLTKYSIKSGGFFTTGEAPTRSIFAVQADPHMDNNSSADVYTQTLQQIALAKPEFLVDLGDIFMVDKLANKDESSIRQRFQMMKDFYKNIGDIPLKIALGNHDGELGYSKFNTKEFRKEYFPDQTGDLAYYAFTGPDQLHVVLDPFTYTTSAPKADGWQWTLGKAQYDWLKQTLESSNATFKFVYIHHLLVGDAQSRGGVEIARLNEWGGNNVDGSYGFDSNRPGWGKPVHQLLLENGVSFVFKGHDHLYVKQELDGITYQTLPQPSHPVGKADATQYGYLSGKAVPGSGFLRVSTEGKQALVEFIKYDGTIADSYTKTVTKS